ncbi:uncharacterized protein BDV17DRAFT_291434 [Aspergillus undulatus]|uniref:uncharacterized protein n=1 Tax=Aspergillus undulatus TaxID=1810928 RepID=UPI003CCD5A4E
MSEIQNVHNPIHFPSLAELPNGAAFPCSEQSPEPDGRWCLLGQIRSVKPSRTSGLIVQVEDKRGKEANIAIPVRDQAGRHLSVDVWQIDWCIMILNPRRIPRNREAINIRVCDLSLVKVCLCRRALLELQRVATGLTYPIN